jgi:hypothetical protein
MRRLFLPLALLAVLLPAAEARAVTIADIIELSRAGLSDDVIVELIEVQGRIYSLDAERILEIRQAGVSERVILAMLRSGRRPEERPASPAVPKTPQAPVAQGGLPPIVVVIEAPAPRDAGPRFEAWRYGPAFVPFPIYGVPVAGHASRLPSRSDPFARSRLPALNETPGFGRFINNGYRAAEPAHPPPEPVFWGWGGKPRPDAWQP